MPTRRRTRDVFVTSAIAQEALEYWLRRLDRLPHRRRAARREARAMIVRWERRYRDAVIAERSRKLLGRLALEAGLTFLLEPPRAPGGPIARRRRTRALRKIEERDRKEFAALLSGKRG
jgi:hypothetical protein